MHYKISYTPDPSSEELAILYQGLEDDAKQKMGKTSFQPFGFLARNKDEELIGGCTGVMMYGVLYIKVLWVKESERGKGIGQTLVEKVEEYARTSHYRYIKVDTFDWQAKEFYEKMGYKVEFVYDGYDNNAKFYFFRKKLE